MSKSELKKIVFILVALLLSIMNAGMIMAETQPPEELQIPGRIEGNGTHFEINNSEYLNVTLDSSEPVKLAIESMPEIVTMIIEPISDTSSTMVTLGGFLPLTTYHKYEDNYHNHTTFMTDASGKYYFSQDISNRHLIFVQPRSSTKFIRNDATGGDCISIGVWDSATNTCKLTTDVYETIQIDSYSITLDGDGHMINGSGTGVGVYIPYKAYVTIKNLNVNHFDYGIWAYYTAFISLINNTASDNRVSGVYFISGRINTLINNTFSNNRFGIRFGQYTPLNFVDNNRISNNYYGITASYDSGANTFTNNIISNNVYGIWLYVGGDDKAYNNNFINNHVQAYVSRYYSIYFNLDKPIGGNYWSNWNSPDADGDGFVDVPYVFTGAQDNIPWTKWNGWKPPTDLTPPTTTISFSGTIGNNGWYTSDVQLTLSGIDEGGSEINKIEYSFDGTNWNQYTNPFTITSERIANVYYKSTDNAGNVEPTKTQTVNIDKTPPQIAINTPANGGIYILNQTLIADWTATDSLSGLTSATGTLPSGAAIDTSTVGSKTFTVAAADNAGNTATQSAYYAISYDFPGILPPIRTDGSSIFKLGSTVPVKFRIADANGNYVSTAVATLTYQKITDDILGTIEEAVSTSEANEGNTFRYDSTDNLYIFNLGTNDMTAGTYQLNINLDDGTVHAVNISLR